MKTLVGLLGALALSGCASTSTSMQLETRVSSLERELAVLRAGAMASHDVRERSASGARAGRPCDQVVDASVPSDTGFPFPIPYDLAPPSTRAGDVVTITEIRGTSPVLRVGAMYLVRGTYTLASAPNATLGFHITATRPGEGCTNSNGRDSVAVTRGAGSFELAVRAAYEGRPHVSFYVEGKGSGGVYLDGQAARVVP